MSEANPKHNSVLQALLDLHDVGYGGLTVDALIQKLATDRKAADALQDKWDAHMYPEKSMTFTRATIADQYMSLSDPALRVLLFMGLRCHQTGLIQVSMADLASLTKLKLRATQAAVKALVEAGCISVKIQSVRHTPPVYEVNRALFAKGKPLQNRFDYSNCGQDGFLLTWAVEHAAAVSTVHMKQPTEDGSDEKTIVYNRITVATPAANNEKEPSDTAMSDSSNTKDKVTTNIPKPPKPVKHKTRDWSTYPNDLPGQMSMNDYDIPTDVNDQSLPFN